MLFVLEHLVNVLIQYICYYYVYIVTSMVKLIRWICMNASLLNRN